jgi:hypothetical protein
MRTFSAGEKSPSEELSRVMLNYLKHEGAERVICPRPYFPPIPIMRCVTCLYLAGAKTPLLYKQPLVLCSYGGKIQECRCLPEYKGDSS